MNSLASVAIVDQATSLAPLPVLITSSCVALSLCTRSFHSHRHAGHRRLVSPRGCVDLAFGSPASIVPWPGGVPTSALAPARTLAPASCPPSATHRCTWPLSILAALSAFSLQVLGHHRFGPRRAAVWRRRQFEVRACWWSRRNGR
jgi:hypothetical protein